MGKIDFSRFGSKRFAKFLDKQSEIVRKSTSVYLAENAPAPKNAPKSANKPEPKAEQKAVEISEQKTAAFAEKLPEENEISAVIVSYLKSTQNGKDKITTVEKQVENAFGKVDLSRFGAKTFAKFLDKQDSLLRKGTSVSLSENVQTADAKSETKLISEPEIKTNNNKKPEKIAKTDKSENAGAVEKAELNAVKREIQIQTVQHENSISLSALGKILRGKYGENYLKDIGALTLKQLVTAVAGVKSSGNYIRIDEEFISQTENIEQFVRDFVAKNGKPSIKSLSTQIKKNFAGFDFTDYGYARFSDFINAIDGVRADGYYVEAE